MQIAKTSSVSQGSVTHLPLQLFSSQGAQERLTVWVEDRVRAQFSGFSGCRAAESFIKPVEEGDNEEGQAKLQLHEQTQKNQPQKHFEQNKVWDDELSGSQPSSQRAIQQPVSTFLKIIKTKGKTLAVNQQDEFIRQII